MNSQAHDTNQRGSASWNVSRPQVKRTAIRLFFVAVLVAALAFTVLDLVDVRVASFFSGHQFFTTIATESLLLVAVYLFIERFFEARQDKRWRQAAEPSLREIRTAAGDLHRIMHHRVMDLPERHASQQQVDEVRTALTPAVDEFDRALTAGRPVLAASPALVAHLLAAEKMRFDNRQFLNDLTYARGGARTSEWFEEAWRVVHQTYEQFDRAYSDVPDDSAYVRRLRLS